MPAINVFGHRYLKEMGIDVWVPRGKLPASDEALRAETGAFDLCFVSYDGYGLVFEEPGKRDEECCRRLCDDIVRAVAGQPSGGELNVLRWPGVESGRVERDEHAAREAVGRYLQSLGPRIIAFGDLAVEYIAGAEHGLVHRDGKTILTAPAITRLIAEPLEKRELWTGLLKLRD